MSDEVFSSHVLASRLDAIERKLDKVLDDHEARLRSVERWVYGIPPTILLATAGIVSAVLRG